jgi:hypothetical protein
MTQPPRCIETDAPTVGGVEAAVLRGDKHAYQGKEGGMPKGGPPGGGAMRGLVMRPAVPPKR